MYICVDFDGTIVKHEFPIVGAAVPGAIGWMKQWNQVGAKIILFTMRSGQQHYDAVKYPHKIGAPLQALL